MDEPAWWCGVVSHGAFMPRKYGVDGFKFDSGDTGPYRGLDSYEHIGPNEHCELYARIGLDYPLNEYRAMWKMAGQPLDPRHSFTGNAWL